MKFEIIGTFKEARREQKFKMVVDQISEKMATDKIYCHFGSNHGIKRKAINIESIKEAKDEEERKQ